MTTSPLRPLGALGALMALLQHMGIAWVLIGAHAANRYRGSARFTRDVDLLLANAGSSLDELRDALERAGWRVQQADINGELLRLQHAELGPADLLVAGTDYQQLAIQRARHELVDGAVHVPVLTIEDVLLHKLIAGRYQDLADIEAILATRPVLDRAYLSEWLAYWSLEADWLRVAGDSV